MRAGRAACAVGLAAIVCLIAASSASALKVKYETENDVVLPDSVGFVEASCPAGYKLTGGGASSDGDYNTTKLQGSYPVDGDDQNGKADDTWRAVVWNTALSSPRIESLAICSKARPLYRSRIFALNGSTPPRVKCPKGTVPTGGGLETGGTFAVPVDIETSRPSEGDGDEPEAWFANASPPGKATPFGETYAICADPGEIELKHRSKSFDAGNQEQGTGASTCRAGEDLVGLGAATNASGSALTTLIGKDSKKDNDSKLDDGVSVTVDNYKPSLQISPEAHAICAE